MSKSALILDTPQSCDKCLLSEYHEYDDIMNARSCPFEIMGDPFDNTTFPVWSYYEECPKPDWCPLKELPEHKPDDPLEEGKIAEKEHVPTDWFQAYCTGWNACLKKIKGTKD